MIENELKNKTAKKKSILKCREIAKLNLGVIYGNAELKIEIREIRAIDDGIQIYARAWKGDKQFGFGSDGSVEWERFRIINPPILVESPSGDIVREVIDLTTKQPKQRRLREDPLQALRDSLVHTILIVGKFGNVIKGKEGQTTTTVYPDANPETTTVDGVVNRDQGINETFANIRANAGDSHTDDVALDFFAYLAASSTSNQYASLKRGIFLFDTSSIPDTDTITSATLSLRGTQINDTLDNLAINICPSNPASNTDLVNSDYNIANWTDTTYVSKDISGLNTTGYEDFALDAAGIANINKTGVSKFGARVSSDISNSAPSWSSNANAGYGGYCADQTGTTDDPKLTIVHGVVAATRRRAFPIWL